MSEPNKALPELPEPCSEVFAADGEGYDFLTPGKCYYTADQMRDYAIRALAASEPGEAYKPIERDESMGREYIPMPGGWEIQTKGSGSTFRIAGPDEDDRLPIEPRPYLHETLTKMARAVNAAWAAHPPTAATPVGIVGERGDVSWRSDQILPVGTKLYAASTQPDEYRRGYTDGAREVLHRHHSCEPGTDTIVRQPEQVREVDESAVEQRVAKAIADVIGHGMSEKCYDMAVAALAALREP